MKKYLGVKLIEAEPMTDMQFEVFKKGAIYNDYAGVETDGYKVIYPDGYISWSPKGIFEEAYMPLTDPEGKSIKEEDVSKFVEKSDISKFGDKTTVVHTTLRNGFVISEASSCVDPKNFDLSKGEEICLSKVKDKVWGYLGFLLQCGKNGMK